MNAYTQSQSHLKKIYHSDYACFVAEAATLIHLLNTCGTGAEIAVEGI